MAARFEGFSPEALDFFRQLADNNTREWFQERKHIYEESVKAPMVMLVETVNRELADFAPEHVNDPNKAIYRIYRDTRFSKDKTPYKTHIGAIFPRRGIEKHSGGSYYFHISASEVMVAGGAYMPGKDELLAIRAHLAEHHKRFAKLTGVKRLRDLMGELQGDQLARAPKGFPPDHPAVDLLRNKQWYFYVSLAPGLATTPDLQKEVIRRFRAMREVMDFLDEAVLQRKRESALDPLLSVKGPSSRRRSR